MSIKELLPEIEEIRDEELRNKVAKTWEMAMKEGGWTQEDLIKIPFTLLIPTEKNLIEHTRMVTKMAMNIADVRYDLNRDLLIAGALLHDVGKLLEYGKVEDGSVRKSPYGHRIRHPVSGAILAEKSGLPMEISHIIASHSKEGEFVERTPEAIVVHHCDFIDFHIEKAKQ